MDRKEVSMNCPLLSHCLPALSLFSDFAKRVLGAQRSATLAAFSFAVLMLGIVHPIARAQTSEWTWMSGSATAGQSGTYNTQGSFTVGSVPGSRIGAVSWTDTSGNLWIFGGGGNDASGNFGFLNDLWEFNPTLNAWAWMGGSSTVPAVNKGQLGVYGTQGTAGSANIPAGRSGAAGWTDASGNLWLFGGAGDDTDYSVNSNGNNLNDLWMYSPSSGEWTWMGGEEPSNSSPAYPGTYGSLGDFTSGAYPGSRNFATAGTDASGNFWLFGGYGQDSTGATGSLNDLWEYKPATNEWAWISGSATGGANGDYGKLQTPASGNAPCARNGAVMWTDSSGNLWLFGGFGFPPNGEGYLNDLWEFNPATGYWAWMAGNDTMGIVPPSGSGWIGVYGTLGSAGSLNNPGSRIYSSTWTDSSGILWLFGGQGYDSAGTYGDLNDLWAFSPTTNEWTWMAGSDLADQPGVYQAAAGPSIAASSIIGAEAKSEATSTNYTPGSRMKAMSWKDSNGDLWVMAGSGVDSKGASGALNDLWKYQLSSFKVGASPASFTISSGGQQNITITVTPENGFSSAVSFACSGQPTGASCSFSPATVTPENGAAATTTLTYHAQTLSASLHHNLRPLLPGTALAFAVCLFGWRKRRSFVLLLMLAVTAAGAGLLFGCGSASNSGTSVTPATSTVTVTATSGTLKQTTTYSITVD
jgi:N-acetylneuraminic acid mutarotase